MKKYKILLFLCLLAWSGGQLLAQEGGLVPDLDYAEPKDYEIGGIEVVGNSFSDANALKSIAKLKIGNKIRVPGSSISGGIRSLWKLRLFTDVQIYATKIVGDVVFLELKVQERPRLSTYSYEGAKKARHEDLNDIVIGHLTKGGIVTDSEKNNTINSIKKYYKDKGYFDALVNVKEVVDTNRANSVRLVFNIDKKDKVKIQDITFSGNTIKTKKLLKKLDGTKPKRKIFSSSKLITKDYEEDKKAIINYYNSLGFRDARIVSDSIWREADGDLRLHLALEEGNQYYFRDISWKGNSIYNDEDLYKVLGIEKGDIFNKELLDTRLNFAQDGRDVSTLYMDNGYLFFSVDPVEVAIVGDSIDLEMRIYEGPQATIDKVTITGNDRTHEHVVRRELRTLPGQKFSRSNIIRSQREIINLGYFNPESLGIDTPVNPQRGTVDVAYTVEEKPSDQLELSAGWGGYTARVIGTLGVTFNNFSLRNLFNKEAWHPLPQGDGQRLSLRAQTNGNFYQSYNFSFTEPWLGGKKPNALTVAGSYTLLTNGLNPESNGFNKLSILRGAVSLGTRLKWPDDNFISSTSLSISEIDLVNRPTIRLEDGTFLSDGNFINISVNQTIARSSISDPLFPKSGSKIQLSVQLTPPYSLFNKKDYDEISPEERFRFLEYQKWKFDAEWYTSLVGKLVLKASAKIGILGSYNSRTGTSPFERFELGGDGLSNQSFAFTGNEIISLRGYEVEDIEATQDGGAPIYDKFTLELRYPISTNPNSTIYAMLFAQGGNAWKTLGEFNPFDWKRSFGGGLRVFLPMFGTLGFDYGFGFDNEGIRIANPDAKLWDYGNFNIILGFEPE